MDKAGYRDQNHLWSRCYLGAGLGWLDGWIEPGGYRRFGNNADGIAALASWVGEHGADLVAMEASGGIEQPAFLALWRAGFPCALANPRQVRCFAEATGKREKTDRIDAEMIAGYANACKVKPTPPPCEQQQRLSALATRLCQINADVSVQKQRLHSTHDPLALKGLREVIAMFTRQAKELTAEIATLVEHDPLWTALDRTFRSVKGVADRTPMILGRHPAGRVARDRHPLEQTDRQTRRPGSHG